MTARVSLVDLARQLEGGQPVQAPAAPRTWADDNADVAAFLTDAHQGGRERMEFVLDVAAQFVRKGSVSERQADAIRRVIARRAEAAAEREAEPTPETPLVAGERLSVEGTIVLTKLKDTRFGRTLKMLVRLDDGNKVWGTVPGALEDLTFSHYNAGEELVDGIELRGRRVRFVATVEASENDEHFGFFSRPRKATLVEGVAA